MITALEYRKIYDEECGALDAVEFNNYLDPEKGWRRSFDSGGRTTIAIGERNGCLSRVADSMMKVFDQYYQDHIEGEPMSFHMFYNIVRSMLLFSGIKFEERVWGFHKVLYITDEINPLL